MASKENQHDLDIAKVTQRSKEIEGKLPKLRNWMEQGRTILSLVKDYWNGDYREVPYWAISAGALSLLYVLNPLDVIPDIVPGFGYLDDATLVAFCLKLIEHELEKYKVWRDAQKAAPPVVEETGKVIDV